MDLSFESLNLIAEEKKFDFEHYDRQKLTELREYTPGISNITQMVHMFFIDITPSGNILSFVFCLFLLRDGGQCLET